jgi:hypothetical protein
MDTTDLGLIDDASVLEEAKATATYSLGLQSRSAHECPTQGMASRTVQVDMTDGVSVIVHEENARQAHEILGKLVPVPIRLIRQSPVPYTYIMPVVSGSTWLAKDTDDWPVQYHIKLAGQIGNIIGRCCSNFSEQNDAIDSFIVPRLERYIEWDEPTIAPHKEFIKGLLMKVEDLRRLPLCLTHWDINLMNVMVTDEADITGVVDWEEMYWMPFGMNTHVIARFAGYNRRGVFIKRTYSESMEIKFWQELFRSAPPEIRGYLPEIQLAKDIGYVLSTFHDASAPPHPSHIGVFNDVLSYNVPDLSTLMSLPLRYNSESEKC